MDDIQPYRRNNPKFPVTETAEGQSGLPIDHDREVLLDRGFVNSMVSPPWYEQHSFLLSTVGHESQEIRKQILLRTSRTGQSHHAGPIENT